MTCHLPSSVWPVRAYTSCMAGAALAKDAIDSAMSAAQALVFMRASVANNNERGADMGESAARPARGDLPPWTRVDLPAPPMPRGLGWIGVCGPGVIVLGVSIG